MHRLANLFTFSWVHRVKDNWKADVFAGITVSIVALPQALAYANLIGLPAHFGLIAAGIPPIIAALFSTSSFLITGPVAIVSLLTASEVAKHPGISMEQLFALVAMLAILAGLIQVVMSLFKLGSLLNYVASPVLKGFTTAAAIIICLSQIMPLFGMQSILRDNHHQIIQILNAISTSNLETTLMGVGSLLALFILGRTKIKSLAVLITVISAIVASMLSGYSGTKVGTFRATLTNPTHFSEVTFSKDLLISLFTGAFIIALAGFIEGVSVAKTLAKTNNDVVRPNRELAAIGFANLTAGAIGSFPISSSVTRTALSANMGAKTNFAAIVASGVVLSSMFLFASYIAWLPKSTLAAVIIYAVFRLINVSEIKKLLETRHRDGFVALITLVASFLFSPQLSYGILIGVVASVLLHLQRGFHPPLGIFFCSDKAYLKSKHMSLASHSSNELLLGVTVDWSLSFQNCSYLQDKVLTHIADSPKKPKYVLIFARSINHIDASAEEVLEDLQDHLESRGIVLLWCGMKPQLEALIKKTGMLDYIGKKHMFSKANEALEWVNTRARE